MEPVTSSHPIDAEGYEIRLGFVSCHTLFLCQNRVLIACVRRIIYSTHTDIKCSQIAKCHE
jgi:hypothetical protein